MTRPVQVFRGLAEVPPDFGPCALTIGNFDGVHAAHRRIMERVASAARQNSWKAAVLTFDPHPAKLVAPARAPRLMTTPAARVPLMAEAGIEEVLILPFTQEIARLTPEEFVRRILVDTLRVRAVLVGRDFRFGAGAAGTTETLAALGLERGFSTEVMPPVERRGSTVSSSGIRALIEAGRVYPAARMLERPHFIEGGIVPGLGIGSRQTVPTLNLRPDSEVLPANGVYVTSTLDLDDERQWESITNIGNRPTFGGGALSIETFLLSPLDGGTPRRIRVALLHRIRAEKKFESPEALRARILLDASRAREWFQRTGRLAARPAATIRP